MLRTRSHKIFRDIISRKGRTVLVVLSILIGVFGVTMMMSLSDLITRQLKADLKPAQISHNHVYVVAPGGTITLQDNQAYFDHIRQLPNVVDVEGQAVYPVYWQKAGADNAKYNDGFMVAFTEPFGQVNLEPVARVTQGRYPDPGANEIAVEQRFADAHGIKVGDQLAFRPLGDSTVPPPVWTVVGLVLHPYFTISPALGDQIPPEDAIYANYADAQQIVGFPGLTAIHLRYTSLSAAKDGADALLATLAADTPYVAVSNFFDDPDSNFLLKVVSQVTNVFAALGVIAMVVSGFLVTNVINTLVLEQKKQIGVMKSLGATLWDVFVVYAGIALIYGAIGTLLGVVIAVPIAGWMAEKLATYAFTYIDGIKLSALGIEVGVIMGLLVPVVAAFLPVLNGTRVTILQAITDLGISSNWGTTRISRWIGHLPFPRTVVHAVSNLWQKKGRLVLTGLALTFAVAAFMGTTAEVTSLRDVINSIYNSTNFEIGVAPLQAQDSATMTRLILDHVPDTEAVYPGGTAAVGLEGYESNDNFNEGSNQVQVLGMDPATPPFNFNLITGTGWQDDPNREGVIISRTIASSMNTGVGDTLHFSYGDRSADYTIIGVQDYPFDQVYMNWRALATLTGYTDVAGQPLASYFFVNLKGDPGIQAVDRQMDQLAAVLNANDIQATLVNQIKTQDNGAQSINVFSIMLNTMSGVMAAVGAIGLLAVLSMAVYERQREIGVMRSVGAGSWTIMSQFLVEGVLVGVAAWIAAVPLSYGLGYGLNKVLPFDYVTYVYPPVVLVIGLAGVVLIAGVASLWPSLAASRKTVSGILRYQ
jgi:putative ABC transport system permease protein